MIDWNHAPDWATHKATDSNGWVYWYERKPIPTPTGWLTYHRCQLAGRPNWDNTLEERPVDNS